MVVNILQVLKQKTNMANFVHSCHSSIACLEKRHFASYYSRPWTVSPGVINEDVCDFCSNSL